MTTTLTRWFGYLRNHRLLKRIGQRGQVLMLFGFIYCAIGLTLILTRDDPTNQIVYQKILSFIPYLAFWGGLWIGVGMVALVAAFLGTGRDVWGFATITFWTLLWASQSFFTVALFGIFRIIIGFSIYLALAGISMIVSGMRGPDDD